MLEQEELWAVPVGCFVWARIAGLNLPIEWTDPKEGQSGDINVMVMTKGNNNEELSLEFMNYWLSSEIQTALANALVDSPVNKQVTVSSDIADNLTYGEDTVVKEGLAHLPADALTMAVCHRHNHTESRMQTSPLTGWGTWRGALATTFSHDAHNLTVFSSNPKDMLVAGNAVAASKGGIAVAQEGEILAALPLPWAGLLSGEGAVATAAAFEKMRAAADVVGDWQPPEREFKYCFGASLVCNPDPRLSDVGVVDPSID